MSNNPGVYIALLLSDEANQKMKDFCSGFNIDLDDAKPIFNEGPLSQGLHSSLIFSEVGDHKNVVVEHSVGSGSVIPSKAVAWEVRHSSITGKRTLGLRIESSALLDLHEQVKSDNNLTHKFPDYTPHITLHYDFEGEVPEELPNFDIELSGVYIKQLENQAPAVKENQTFRVGGPLKSSISTIRTQALSNEVRFQSKPVHLLKKSITSIREDSSSNGTNKTLKNN